MRLHGPRAIALLLVAQHCVMHLSASSTSTTSASARIKHVVVVMEENRSFDHFFGFAKKLAGMAVDGLTGHESNPLNGSRAHSRRIAVDDQSPYLGPCDPDHSTPATTAKIFGVSNAARGKLSRAHARMQGFVEFEQGRHGNSSEALNWCGVLSMFTPDRLPVLTTMAKEFAIMDQFFCSHPGPTWPNRMFMLSATSAGSTSTGPWYHNEPGRLFPQRTFFDELEEHGRTWRNYYNDTPWELFMEKIATSPDNVRPLTEFFADAAAGTLPSFSWINPRSGINISTGVGSNDQHPDHDVAAGEEFYKDLYEAVRAGPGWNETLFVVTYDEHGGFYDHVPPPMGSDRVAAPGDGEASYPDVGFVWDRLGVRVPTILVSPWIPPRSVVSDPPLAQRLSWGEGARASGSAGDTTDASGPRATRATKGAHYDLTSIMATTRKLFGMPDVGLTGRDRAAPTFEHVLSLSQPRASASTASAPAAPLHMPAAPPRAQSGVGLGADSAAEALDAEARAPLNDLQQHIGTVHAHLSGATVATSAGTHTFGRGAGHPRRQGSVSGWLQDAYAVHAVQVRGHRDAAQRESTRAQERYQLRCRARDAGKATTGEMNWLSTAWNLTAGHAVSVGAMAADADADADADAGAGAGAGIDSARSATRGVGWMQVMTRSELPDGSRYCLDAGWPVGAGSELHVARCRMQWPIGQRWVLSPFDQALTPFGHPQLCATAHLYDGHRRKNDTRVTLQRCSGSVAQHWAWHGAAPGDTGGGGLQFGDDANALGVIAV